MILTKEDTIVRNALKVSEDIVAVSTEKGDLKTYKHTPVVQ